MRQLQTFSAIIEEEDDGFVALCPQLDIASQGDTVQEAKSNLTEAIELFLEVANPFEIQSRQYRKTMPLAAPKGRTRASFIPAHK